MYFPIISATQEVKRSREEEHKFQPKLGNLRDSVSNKKTKKLRADGVAVTVFA